MLKTMYPNTAKPTSTLHGKPYRLRAAGLFLLLVTLASFVPLLRKPKPTIYLIGDSTVRNSDKEQWGWGSVLPLFFDTGRIRVANHAMAGRSSRSFTKEGRFRLVDSLLRPGDFVLMQFGHNDGSYPDTSAKNRGTLKGTGEDTVVLNYADGRREVVHSYGWYIRQFVRQARARGATPVVLSMVPRNIFKDGKVPRAGNDFGKWAKEVALAEGAFFVDLNAIAADKFDAMGPAKVATLFHGDHTHTNRSGALLNAASLAEGLRAQRPIGLRKYLLRSRGWPAQPR